MRKIFLIIVCFFFFQNCFPQLKWTNVDSLYQPLPSSVHVYFTDQQIDTAAFLGYYVIADIKDKKLEFTDDTTLNRRITPSQFYEKDGKPLVVVNCAFFSFTTNRSVSTIIKNGKVLAYDTAVRGKGKDSLKYFHAFKSAIGISKKRKADVAWTLTDSSKKHVYASQWQFDVYKDSTEKESFEHALYRTSIVLGHTGGLQQSFHKWKMKTAVGGGPVLLQNGEIKITNNEELMFAGKAINDKHPRTAMGYTKDNKLVILVIQGRSESSGGANLIQEAQILKDIGCVEALNLDGGGSSCMLVNGKETITPSDKEGERPVPAVFLIKNR
jgi:exopolysaccharide biosynthesis protein